MAAIQIIQNAAENASTEIDDRLMHESREAVLCMAHEELLSVALWVLEMARKWDQEFTEAVYTGKVAADFYSADALANLFTQLTRLREVSIQLGEIHERKGFDVRHINEIRAFSLDDFTTYAAWKLAQGESFEGVPQHVDTFFSKSN